MSETKLLIKVGWDDLTRGYFNINTSEISLNYPIRIDLSEIKEVYKEKMCQLDESLNAARQDNAALGGEKAGLDEVNDDLKAEIDELIRERKGARDEKNN